MINKIDQKEKRKESQEKNKSIENFLQNKKIRLGMIIFLVVFITTILSIFWYSLVYANKIYPNIYIGEENFSSLPKEKAIQKLEDLINKNLDKKIVLKYEDKIWEINAKDINLNYNKNETIEKLYSIGRSDNFLNNLLTRIKILFSKKNISASYSYNNILLNQTYKDIFSFLDKPAINAKYDYQNEKIKILPEEEGLVVDKYALKSDIDKSFNEIIFSKSINIITIKQIPKITKNILEDNKQYLDKIIENEIILDSEIEDINIQKEKIFSWIDIVLNDSNQNNENLVKNKYKAFAQDNNKIFIDIIINQNKIRNYLQEISKNINKEAKDAKLTFSDGKVSIFQSPEKGYELNCDETAKSISNHLYLRYKVLGVNTEEEQKNKNKISLSLKIKDPDVNDTDIDKYGIKELIATGSTSFYGSSSSRIYNIKHGAEQFNGILLKPGDTLSAIGVLGDPSAETGYLPELVIKGNKTIPEYGGGLCQVSTTLFRTALNAGFEILERHNHAYRVGYYEPPVGMDATIYYPKPDLIVKNNTPNYVLVQTRIEGTKIYFDFYGTKDDRKVEITDPVIYETYSPPQAKYIESADLPAGTIKRSESEHAGAKVSFNYKVIVNGKEIINKNFYSNYQAWQAVYLYGPGTENIPGKENKKEESSSNEPKPEQSQEPTPSPTPENSPTPTPTPTN